MDQYSVPLTRPTLPTLAELQPDLERIWASGVATQGGCTLELERRAAALAGVEHCVALNSCTSGMMLLLAALDVRGEVLMPSFTWASTAHAALWNGLTPVFCDVSADELTVDPQDVERRLTSQTGAVLAVNVFGLPPDLTRLESICRTAGVPLLVDSAQGLGSKRDGRPQGAFGAAEVFSLSPTKVVTALEGGLVATRDVELAGRVRSMRDYGKGQGSAGPDILRLGLSARMSEVHAAVACRMLDRLDRLIAARSALVERYRSQLAGLPGIGYQARPVGAQSVNTYFVILINENCPLDRGRIVDGLAQAGIQSKPYFWPPVHMQQATRRFATDGLLVTERAARQSLALPLWSEMPIKAQDRVIETLHRLLRG